MSLLESPPQLRTSADTSSRLSSAPTEPNDVAAHTRQTGNSLPDLRAGATVLVASAVAAVVFWSTWSADWLAIDTAQTLSVARHLHQQGQLATDVIFYEEHLQFDSVPLPQTVFPPGYPALVAGLMLGHVSEITAARIVVTASWVVVPILIWMILVQLGHDSWTAAGVGLLWLFMQPAWDNALGLNSELPFLALTLSAFVLLFTSSRKSPRLPSLSVTLLAGGLAALACSVRYAGLFFVLAAGMVLFIEWMLKPSRSSLLRMCALGVLPGLTIGGMFLRNLWLVGDPKGGNNQIVLKPVGDVARTMWYSLTDLWGWSRIGLIHGEPAEWALLCGGVLLAVLVLAKLRSGCLMLVQQAGRVTPSPALQSLPTVYVAVTIVSLFWLERSTSIGLCPRFLLPIVPCLLIAAVQGGSRLVRNSQPVRDRGIRLLPGICSLLLVGSVLVGQAELWSKHEPPPNVALIRRALASLQTEEQAIAALDNWRTLLSTSGPVLCNESHYVSLLTRWPVLGLATPNYTDRAWESDDVYELVSRYGVTFVLLMPDVLPTANEDATFFNGLVEGQIPEWLRLEHANEWLHIYRVLKIDERATPLRSFSTSIPHGPAGWERS